MGLVSFCQVGGTPGEGSCPFRQDKMSWQWPQGQKKGLSPSRLRLGSDPNIQAHLRKVLKRYHNTYFSTVLLWNVEEKQVVLLPSRLCIKEFSAKGHCSLMWKVTCSPWIFEPLRWIRSKSNNCRGGGVGRVAYCLSGLHLLFWFGVKKSEITFKWEPVGGPH